MGTKKPKKPGPKAGAKRAPVDVVVTAGMRPEEAERLTRIAIARGEESRAPLIRKVLRQFLASQVDVP